MAYYDYYKTEIESGDLLAWSSTAIELKIVQLFTLSSFDHVGIAWRVDGRLFVIEARPPEIRIYPLSKLRPFYHVPMHIDWSEDYTEYLLEHVGDPYSRWEAIRAFFNISKKDNHWQCAEFANSFYSRVGLDIDFGLTPRSVVDAAIEHSRHGIIKVV